MSEAWAFVSCDPPPSTREQRVHASGYPMIDCELRVVDPATGVDAPPGVPGELLVRGYTVMDGYWDNNRDREATLVLFELIKNQPGY
jgi:long-subunit acyl-CoA synthetase (AMP-forming)